MRVREDPRDPIEPPESDVGPIEAVAEAVPQLYLRGRWKWVGHERLDDFACASRRNVLPRMRPFHAVPPIQRSLAEAELIKG